MRVIKMMSGDIIPITEKEFEKLSSMKSGLVFIPSLNEMLNISSIERVMGLESYARISKEGVLHDGRTVIKRFGEWVDPRNPEIKLDTSFYPEIASDNVRISLPVEFEEILKLEENSQDRIALN